MLLHADIMILSEWPLWIGLVAAIVHVLSGPDHLAAVTPLVIESKRKFWRVGFMWGIGHVIGMLAIGLLFLAFKDVLPLESISHYSERFVGVILIALAAWAFYKVYSDKKTHVHPHVHEGEESYIHIHKHHHHGKGHVHQHTHLESDRQHNTSSMLIGIIHGFAGVSHFVLLLPVLGFSNMTDSVMYIVGFGIGSIVAMTFYAVVLGRLSGLSQKNNRQQLYNGIRISGGVLALAIGIYWLLI